MTGKKDMKLEELVTKLCAEGIAVDRRQLRESVCRQFPDYRLWIREYIVNAFDAGARNCHVTGVVDGSNLTVTIEDDGWGMNRQQVESFLTKFRSCKEDTARAVGRFGIGSFSPAAIPEQHGFSMLTSTGEETWYLSMGSLLDDQPIRVDRLKKDEPRGTRFDISFTCVENTPAEEVNSLAELARKYLFHVPINVFFHNHDMPSLPGLSLPHWTPGNWAQEAGEDLAKRFCREIDGETYDIVMALTDRTRQAFYQKRVLISDNLQDRNLLTADNSDALEIPHLSIRVDSDAFELPLGRHTITNNYVLLHLAKLIRNEVIHDYITMLVEARHDRCQQGDAQAVRRIEQVLVGCLMLNKGIDSVGQVRLFRLYNGERVSFSDLHEIVRRGGCLYLEDEDASSGLDYSVFTGAVLSQKQPGNGLEILRHAFDPHIVNLSHEDLIQEAPASSALELSDEENGFERNLGVCPAAVRDFLETKTEEKPIRPLKGGPVTRSINLKTANRVQQYVDVFEDIRWRVGHLVQRDGVTPCVTALYLYRGGTVILNLYHESIRKLVRLSRHVPALAGHFAVALCLSTTGKSSILPNMLAEDREDILNLDAILRCEGMVQESGRFDGDPRFEEDRSLESMDDFELNNLDDELPF